VRWLGALVPRMMYPGSLAAAARHAAAEPLWTGRPRPYAESTVRQAALRLDAEGASALVADAVWKQVTDAVARADQEVIAHTDMFDQPYYTKKFAHAAPIGRLGNRLLACAYFGLTTIKIPAGPTLFAHLSWHKPASPLRDAQETTGVSVWMRQGHRGQTGECCRTAPVTHFEGRHRVVAPLRGAQSFTPRGGARTSGRGPSAARRPLGPQ
jgi:hypothetical protein